PECMRSSTCPGLRQRRAEPGIVGGWGEAPGSAFTTRLNGSLVLRVGLAGSGAAAAAQEPGDWGQESAHVQEALASPMGWVGMGGDLGAPAYFGFALTESPRMVVNLAFPGGWWYWPRVAFKILWKKPGWYGLFYEITCPLVFWRWADVIRS
ncbi:hypothetical protein TcCL_ESM00776, partial [Trypanosoma cruzi]